MNWYPRYPGDYMRDTAHLSLTEHGAYNILLDHYYSTGEPLTKSTESLIRICRAYEDYEKDAVKAIADKFFPVNPDGLRHNKRADKQLAEMNKKHEALSKAGKRGMDKRWKKAGNKQANKVVSNEVITYPQPQPQPDTTDQKPQPKTIKEDIPPSGGKAAKAPRKRNPTLDALAELHGDLKEATPPVWSRCTKALQNIRTVCPEVDAAEIRRRAAVYRKQHPEWDLTSTALAAHWANCKGVSTHAGIKRLEGYSK